MRDKAKTARMLGRSVKPGAVALLAATSLLALAACGGGSAEQSDSAAVSTVTINGLEPQNPLVPSNTNESGGANVMDNIFTGLIKYNPETAAPENAIAESISSPDQTLWTIKVQPGWTFHDGTPVTAASFVDAWNYAANGANAQINQYFFEPIAGYADIAGEDASAAAKLSGLTVVSDYEFTVQLSRPNSQFPLMLGYSGFAPLPASFFADPVAFGENPIGNGPFKFESWDKGSQITLSRYDDYKGAKPKVDQAVIKIYQSVDAAYADLLANNLDVLETLPTSALAGKAYQTDLDGRVVEQPQGTIETLAFPLYDARFTNPELRAAFSMAIDRQAIIDNIFEGALEAATGWVSPVVDGYKPDACGENCTFNPEQARAKLAAAGGFDGPITIAYNADGDHQAWVDAACVSITNTLSVPCTGQPSVDFKTFLQATDDRQMDGLFRAGWYMDYPSIENFLVPVYKTGASSNVSDYSNPQFDALMDEGAATAGAEGLAKFQQGEALLAQDMPTIPMWYGKTVAGYSENVTNVELTAFSRVDLSAIEVK